MNSKYRRHHGTTPKRSRNLPEEKEKDDAVSTVQQDIYGMVAGRIRPEKRNVQLVRDPCQRVPI